MREVWKDIKGYVGYYRISSMGRILSLARKGRTSDIFLYPTSNTTGYWQIGLTKNKTRRIFCIHRLVAEAFLPNPEYKPTVNHIDGDTSNNTLENLEWATQSENNLHAIKTGARWDIGERHHSSKLKEHQVLAIREKYNKGGVYMKDLAAEYGVRPPAIQDIIHRKTWKHL